jgi:hypothetical protein
MGTDLAPIDRHGGGAGEVRFTVDDLEAVAVGKIDVLVLTHVSDQVVLLRDQRRQIDGTHVGRKPGERVRTSRVIRLRGGQQRFGWDAADVHAGATNRAALDHEHPGTQAAPVNRRRERAATRTDDHQVVINGHVRSTPGQCECNWPDARGAQPPSTWRQQSIAGRVALESDT